jgi:hypothetical protein
MSTPFSLTIGATIQKFHGSNSKLLMSRFIPESGHGSARGRKTVAVEQRSAGPDNRLTLTRMSLH